MDVDIVDKDKDRDKDRDKILFGEIIESFSVMLEGQFMKLEIGRKGYAWDPGGVMYLARGFRKIVSYVSNFTRIFETPPVLDKGSCQLMVATNSLYAFVCGTC